MTTSDSGRLPVNLDPVAIGRVVVIKVRSSDPITFFGSSRWSACADVDLTPHPWHPKGEYCFYSAAKAFFKRLATVVEGLAPRFCHCSSKSFLMAIAAGSRLGS
jgi:hypothetical protein